MEKENEKDKILYEGETDYPSGVTHGIRIVQKQNFVVYLKTYIGDRDGEVSINMKLRLDDLQIIRDQFDSVIKQYEESK